MAQDHTFEDDDGFGIVIAGVRSGARWPTRAMARAAIPVEQARAARRDTPELRIARDTLRMPDAIAGVMGGPTKAEAREIVAEADEGAAFSHFGDEALAIAFAEAATGDVELATRMAFELRRRGVIDDAMLASAQRAHRAAKGRAAE